VKEKKPMSAELFSTKADSHATLRFAKILNETGHSSGLDKGTYHRELERLAKAAKRSTESMPQAYTRIATETPEGRELFKAYHNAPVGKQPVQAAQDLPYQPVGDASAELERTAREAARSKNISYERAYTALLTDPTRKELVARVRREELDATRMVRDQRWPNNQAEQQSKTRDWSRRNDI
jgi:hypothetical protein